ncbi:MAG: hypothetical protein B6242_00585 [Anaerolineaceae bacterium 4572_78]|nr:MAG: hypothetical protein B6242_00585 [Anaerolineaceae bacterium 4572_78]
MMNGSSFIRNAPSHEARRAGTVASLGTLVEILAMHGDWYKIQRTAGSETEIIEITGWVLKRWVTPIQPIPDRLITPTVTP